MNIVREGCLTSLSRIPTRKCFLQKSSVREYSTPSTGGGFSMMLLYSAWTNRLTALRKRQVEGYIVFVITHNLYELKL